MGQWYMMKDGKTVGPFNDDAIKSMYETGIINSNTALWSEDLDRFEPISNIDVFKNEPQNVPPPVSPKFRKEVVGSQAKNCPHCKNQVPIRAIKCMHCDNIIGAKKINNEDSTSDHQVFRPKAKSSYRGLYIAIAVVAFIFLLIANYSCIYEPEEPPLPLPRSGVMTTNYSRTDANAPFELVSKRGNDHYYIKLYHYGSERLAASAFLRAGERTEFEVPLGTYELRWAVGKDWRGTSKHFGRRTEYYKSRDILRFTETAEYVHGWVIEFDLRTGGNIERTSIDEEDF